MNLFEMFEARDLTNPNITYSEKKVKKEVDRVTATLQGNDSGAFTRVAKRYKQIDRLQASLKIKRDELNKEVTAKVEALFNAEDEIYTRVVDTVSIVMTLSKKTEVTTEDFDIDGYLEEVETLLVGFEKKLQLLRAKYTEVETITKKSALRVKIKESTSIWDKISSWADKIYKHIVSSLAKADAKIDKMKTELGVNPEIVNEIFGLSDNPFNNSLRKPLDWSYALVYSQDQTYGGEDDDGGGYTVNHIKGGKDRESVISIFKSQSREKVLAIVLYAEPNLRDVFVHTNNLDTSGTSSFRTSGQTYYVIPNRENRIWILSKNPNFEIGK